MKIYRFYKNIHEINIKTIYFNFKYFEFKKAIKLPVLIHEKARIQIIKGEIILPKRVFI